MFVVVGVVAALQPPVRFIAGPFGCLMVAAMFGWGVVLIASWFAPHATPARRAGSIQRAMRFASRLFAVVFLLGWFGAAAVLLVLATLALV